MLFPLPLTLTGNRVRGKDKKKNRIIKGKRKKSYNKGCNICETKRVYLSAEV